MAASRGSALPLVETVAVIGLNSHAQAHQVATVALVPVFANDTIKVIE
jgi:hypothetical protein